MSWSKPFVLKYTDFPTASAGPTAAFGRELFTGEENTVEAVKFKTKTTWTGTGPLTALTLAIGVTGTATKYMGATAAMTADDRGQAQTIGHQARDSSLLATLALTGSTGDVLTAGKTFVWVKRSTQVAQG